MEPTRSTDSARAILTTQMYPKDPNGLWPTTFPTIDTSGGTAVGDTVSLASVGVWDANPQTSSYQWVDSSQPIAGATGTTYTLQPGDVNKNVWLKVTVCNPGYGYRTVDTSDSTGDVSDAVMPSPAVQPTILGSTQTGHTITAVVSSKIALGAAPTITSGTWSGSV
jgi:hypothetical protein